MDRMWKVAVTALIAFSMVFSFSACTAEEVADLLEEYGDEIEDIVESLDEDTKDQIEDVVDNLTGTTDVESEDTGDDDSTDDTGADDTESDAGSNDADNTDSSETDGSDTDSSASHDITDEEYNIIYAIVLAFTDPQIGSARTVSTSSDGNTETYTINADVDVSVCLCDCDFTEDYVCDCTSCDKDYSVHLYKGSVIIYIDYFDEENENTCRKAIGNYSATFNGVPYSLYIEAIYAYEEDSGYFSLFQSYMVTLNGVTLNGILEYV